MQRHGLIDDEDEDLDIHGTENVEERDGRRSCPRVYLERQRFLWHKVVGEYLGEAWTDGVDNRVIVDRVAAETWRRPEANKQLQTPDRTDRMYRKRLSFPFFRTLH